MKEIKDQLGRSVVLSSYPKRIVSLVPSQTELLHYLELDNETVGITKFCVHPNEWRSSKVLVGGTKNPDLEKIRSLKPDLIVANKEENRLEDIEELAAHFPVWVSDVHDLNSALQMIRSVGELTDRAVKAGELCENLSTSFHNLGSGKSLKAVYLIWWNPIMVAGKDTFISKMMLYAGFENLCLQPRYPATDIEAIRSLNPDYVLLSSEPFPFSEKQKLILQNEFPNAKIRIVDGEMFSWYGPRMLDFPRYIRHLDV